MATTVTTPTMEAGLEAARSALTSALSGTPTPAESAPPAATPPPESPAPAPAVEVSPTPSSSPAPPAGNPPAPGGQPAPLSFTDPAAQRYLEMNGGNAEAALAKALRDNNRLAELAKTNPDLFKPGAPADPSRTIPPDTSTLFTDPSQPVAPELGRNVVPPPIAAPVAPAEIPVDWEKVTASVQQAVLGDETCRGLISQWTTNDKANREAQEKGNALTARQSYLSTLLREAENLSLPEMRVEEFRDELRSITHDLSALETSVLLRSLQNDRLDQTFRERRSRIFDDVASRETTQAQEAVFTENLKQLQESETQRLSSGWAASFPRVVSSHQIPQELVADFGQYAKQMAAVALESPGYVIEDVEVFLTSVAKGYKDRLDKYHRAQAATYGAQAAARAASPSPAPIPGSPSPAPAPHPTSMTPEQAMDAASRQLRERGWRG